MRIAWPAVARYTIGLGLGFGLLYLALGSMDLAQWQDLYRQLDATLFLASFAPMALAHWLRARRWRQLLAAADAHVETRHAFASLMVGYLANLAVPRLGEITRCTLLARQSRIPFASAAGTVVTERVTDVLVLALLLLWLLLAESARIISLLDTLAAGRPDAAGNLVPILMGLAVTALVGLGLLWYFRAKLLRWKPFVAAQQFALQLFKAVGSVRYLRQPWHFAFYTIGIWLCYGLNAWLVLQALSGQPPIGLYLAMQIMAIGAIGMAAPVPGGIGSFHALIVLAYAAFQLPTAAGQGAAVVMHAASTLTSLLGGLLAWLYLLGQRHPAAPPKAD